VGVEIDEEVVYLIENFFGTRVGTIDLVMTRNGDKLGFEGLGEHVTSLRRGPSEASTRSITPSTS